MSLSQNKFLKITMILKLTLFVMLSFFLSSCAFHVDVNKPVDLVWDKLGNKTDGLIIFLPGIYDEGEIFEKEQFFDIARKEGIKDDLVAASIHIDHILEKKAVKRIEQDIFNDAVNKGYKNIWFVGVSLGGLNSLLFNQVHAKEICGVVLLAPYLGDKAITKKLALAGGINNWKPTFLQEKEIVNNRIQNLWVWIKKQNGNNDLKHVYIGYGNKDRYVESMNIFANLLDKKNVIVVEGKHDWKTGRKVWEQQLATREQTGLLKACH